MNRDKRLGIDSFERLSGIWVLTALNPVDLEGNGEILRERVGSFIAEPGIHRGELGCVFSFPYVLSPDGDFDGFLQL